MTNYPGEGQPPQDPSNEPTAPQPGYWEQQGQQPPQQPPPPPQQYAYPPQGYAQPAPQGYAMDHPKATTSLVLGILGVVLCSIVAPFAWSMGKKTLTEIDASGGQLGGRGSAQAGYVLGIVGTVLLAVGIVFLIIYVIIIIAALGFGATTSP